ncbi:MAG: metal-dependent hydrolase [Anaerolineae bacterium]|nr:metal-dependent hydrolase [Anaerolineae bacterium]
MIIGHLGISALLHRYAKADLAPVMIAGMMPDIVDKTLCQILHLTPSGRMAAHTLLGLAISTGIVAAIWGKRTAWSWALGYLGHLVADAGGEVPWLYPFVHYDFPPSPSLWETLMYRLSHPLTLLPELFLCIWAGFANGMGSRFWILDFGKNRKYEARGKE